MKGREFIDRLANQRSHPELFVPCPHCAPPRQPRGCPHCLATRKISRAARRQLEGARA